jgi:hypothetical protein
VGIRPKLSNSFLWALANLALATISFIALYTVRFSGIGIWLVKFVFVGLLGTFVFSLVDLCRRKSRMQGFLALLLCLPILAFFGILTVWEGPLYVAVSDSQIPEFQVDGAAGFHGLRIYGPEHSNAEWLTDDIGLVWSFNWQRHDRFPRMRIRFAYGVVPADYSQDAPLAGTAPRLDPSVPYTLVVQPAMGMPEFFILRGGALTKARSEYGAAVCWAPVSVPERHDTADVRVDCQTKKPLTMSQRGQDRLRAYKEKRIV